MPQKRATIKINKSTTRVVLKTLMPGIFPTFRYIISNPIGSYNLILIPHASSQINYIIDSGGEQTNGIINQEIRDNIDEQTSENDDTCDEKKYKNIAIGVGVSFGTLFLIVLIVLIVVLKQKN
jgi:hypothetical protein